MEEIVKRKTQEELVYQRAKYRVHDTDDPALRDYYRELIKNYETAHPQDKKTCSCARKLHAAAVLAEKQR